MTDIYDRIEYELDRRGLYRADLSRDSGISEGTIRGWKRGCIPSAEALYKISKSLGVTMDYLITGSYKINKETFSPEDMELMNLIRGLSEKDKETIRILAKTLAAQSVASNVAKTDYKEQ